MMRTLIRGGSIFDVKNGHFFESSILICGGKIEKIGGDMRNLDAECIIDGRGMKIFPGFIDAHSHIGMWTYMKNGNDANECVTPATPEMRAIDGVNPKDPCFMEAARSGITTVMVTPGSGNVIGGMAAVLKTCGKTVPDMTVKEYAALKIALGENPKNVYNEIKKSPSSRMAAAAILEENFSRAKLYFEKKMNGEIEEDDRWEIFVPLFKKEIPLKIHAHRADDILTGIRIAEKYGFKYTLDHCTEGYLIKDELKTRNVPLLLGPLFMFRSKCELMKSSPTSVKVLCEEGCSISIISDHPFTNCKYLRAFTGLLVREGLNYDDAVRMLTVNPAKALNLYDRLGSIEEGKDADIIMCDGDPLELQTRIVLTMINGKIVHADRDMAVQFTGKGDFQC